MNRRAFLAALAAAAIAPAANAAFAPLAAPRRKVVIAGGGLAGLSCAYELQKYGVDVVVLEGQGAQAEKRPAEQRFARNKSPAPARKAAVGQRH